LIESLRNFSFEARSRDAFWERPEVRRLFPGGRGLVALFAGSPGVGKTMAAQIIARDIGVDIFRIDLAMLMSKYIGETTKNLKTVFLRATQMHALLLFDEADALFSNRTEVKDSHDRYANTDTNYLLQQLESFPGIAILASNRKTNIDGAFLRRIRYVYDFPRPDAADRRRLWRKLAHPILGETSTRDLNGTLDALGDSLELSGAEIKNALVASYFVARRRGADPTASDILIGIERELAKEGRSLSPRERQRLLRDG
jgi:SpoVK/Ycf46/Vps4 family AAA+-type ATPase